ncbi:MAG: hypothetical protein ACQCXQ_13160 [Verrucomicrobiales bacterium]|nr:hypothetical protein [Verrucomicrobiota bacterium JB025]
MTPYPNNINPSQTVERIREIIVGRHLEKLEQRVARLECQPAATTAHPAAIPTQLEDRLSTYDARIEALQDSVNRVSESSRDTVRAYGAQQQEEIQRLSSQIQKVAAAKAAEQQPSSESTQQLEQRIGAWLSQWQGAIQKHLVEHDEQLTEKIHEDVVGLWENTESHITRLESRMLDHAAIEERFRRIAAAARALAESASPEEKPAQSISPQPQ